MSAAIYGEQAVLPASLERLINLADARIGTSIVSCSDEFFAPATRMLQPGLPVFVPDKYDDHGKWMDGWETRRKRYAGYDWCIVRLGVAGRISGVDIDTTFFSGNYPASASLEGCYSPSGDPAEDALWFDILPNQNLKPSQHHVLECSKTGIVTHLRLNIFPDGGVARLRVYGEVAHDWQALSSTGDSLNLVAMENGGRIVAFSDAHFGHPQNMLSQGRGINMGDGWETKRRRAPGSDWCIIALGHAGNIEKIEVDTAHFKGNFPAFCSIQAVYVENATDFQLVPQSMFWPYLLKDQPLSMDHIHEYLTEIEKFGKVSHIRLNMIPDGGISRIRLWGKPAL